jgi:uncharacterized cupredoxin-like copper-binding protein
MRRLQNPARRPILGVMARAVPRIAALAVAVACAPALAGCGAHRSSTDDRATAVHVTEKDFKITAPDVIRAGDVRLVIANKGPDDHELAVVRAPIVGTLPMRADGVTVDEDATEHATAGALEPESSGTVSELHVRLRPGRYMLLCNMSGHYLGGMYTTVVVR